MARAGLGLSVADLANASDVSANTILRFEAGNVPTREGSIAKIQSTLQDRGCTFLINNEHGHGVRVRVEA